MKVFSLLLIIFFMGRVPSAHADLKLLIDPVLGYSNIHLDKAHRNLSAVSNGIRLGGTIDPFHFAWSYMETRIGGAQFPNFTENGLFVGYRNGLFRYFAEAFHSRVTDTDFNPSNGNGFKFGINFYLFEKLSLELATKYTYIHDNQVIGTKSNDFSNNTVFIGINVPLEIGSIGLGDMGIKL